jgi:hypothetical protein
MKGIIDMTAAGAGVPYAQLDGIASNASGLQSVSDSQSGIMQQLANTMDGLATSLQGMAGHAAQVSGQNLHAKGMQISTAFADQSHMMNNNAALHVNNDEAQAHILGQVAHNLT